MAQPREVGAVGTHRHQQPVPPKPKPKAAPEPPKTKRNEPVANAATKRTNAQDYGNHQKARLNAALAKDERRDNSALIGGTAGSTAAQFEISEQRVRNTGVIKIRGDATTPADFVHKVEERVQRLAPNSTVETRPPDNQPDAQKAWDNKYGSETLGIVHKPETTSQPRVPGHQQGYRLLDQLHNNPNEVTINYQTDTALARPRVFGDAVGKVTAPGKGSPVDVFYDPAYNRLPAPNPSDTLANLSKVRNAAKIKDSTRALSHEFGHASHGQRGTISNVDNKLAQKATADASRSMGTQGKENVFSRDGKFYREGNNMKIHLREEFRNIGADGHRYGKEPTENSIRPEIGIHERRDSYQRNANVEISPRQARIDRFSAGAQTIGDNALDGLKGSRNSALIGAGFNSAVALYQGKDARGAATDALIGAGSGVTEEVIERTVNGARSTTSGMTNNAFRAAASQVKGAAIAGAVVNTAFTIYDQAGNLQNDTMRSQAVGTIAGEAVVGAASGASGAYAGALAGAAIGSVFPVVGTAVGGVVGFAVGAGVGYFADKGLRGLGVDTAVAAGVTATYDAVADLGSQAGQAIGNAGEAIGSAAENAADAGKNLVGGAVNRLSSIFG